MPIRSGTEGVSWLRGLKNAFESPGFFSVPWRLEPPARLPGAPVKNGLLGGCGRQKSKADDLVLLIENQFQVDFPPFQVEEQNPLFV